MQKDYDNTDTRERLLYDILDELPLVEHWLDVEQSPFKIAKAKELRAFLKRGEALRVLAEERP